MKRIMLLGATGSIGKQCVDVVLHHQEEFEIVGISIGYQIDKLKQILSQIQNIKIVCVASEESAKQLQANDPSRRYYFGREGLLALAAYSNYDVLVNAVVGFRGLEPLLCAINHNKDVALANKESLVCGGDLVKQALKKHPINLYPIDSEHSAIFQCLQGNKHEEIDSLIITASGGSLRDYSREELIDITPKQALHHPNWSMGGRITIDSATMMNKGFEIIEAHYLFDIPSDRINVVLHRESIIHSMVQYVDHAIIAQLGSADMRLPIQYALSYPDRLIMPQCIPLDITDIGTLHFEKMSFERYPLLKLAYEVLDKKGNSGAIINGADEEAISLFLQNKISFLDIETSIFKAYEAIPYIKDASFEDIEASDRQAREFVRSLWKGVM